MQFPGYWVKDTNGKVIVQAVIFDETELDPKTNWKEAWQNLDPVSTTKGFVETSKALAYAGRLIARNQGHEISDEEILVLQSAPSLFQDGKCKLQNLDDFRLLCTLLNTLETMNSNKVSMPASVLQDAVDEIHSNNLPCF